jgi:hypothetical protein
VTYATGCITYTDTVDIIINGLYDAALDKVHVFPIPAQEVIHVDGIDGDFHFDIYDLTGRLINKGQSSSGDISISELMVGTYFLRIGKDGREYTLLFVKE